MGSKDTSIFLITSGLVSFLTANQVVDETSSEVVNNGFVVVDVISVKFNEWLSYKITPHFRAIIR